MTLDEIVMKTLDHADALEFLCEKSKAKDKEKQKLRELKRLRDFLALADLNAFKID